MTFLIFRQKRENGKKERRASQRSSFSFSQAKRFLSLLLGLLCSSWWQQKVLSVSSCVGKYVFFLSFLRVLDEETLRWLAWQYDDCEEMETGKNGAKKNDGVPKGQRSIIPYAEIESR